MARRFNREQNRKIIESLIKEQQTKQERVDDLVKKFKKKGKPEKFVSDCKNDYKICESRLKFKEV